MSRGGDGDQFVGQEGPGRKRDGRPRPEPSDHGEIRLVRDQSVVDMLPVSDVQADIHVRMGFPEGAEHVGKDVDTYRGVAGESKQAAAKPVKLVQRMTSHLEVGDDPAGVLVEEGAGTREMNAATDFLEERRPYCGRKRLDLMGDGRL